MPQSARISDVARRAGVSTATVSHVINGTRYVSEETRARVLAAIAELEYLPSAVARSLKTKSTGTLGVAVSDISNPYFTAIVRGIEDVASANDYNVIICNTDEDKDKEQRYLRVLLAKRIDGLIIAPTGFRSPLLETMQAAGIPIVLVDRSVEGMNLPIIKVDNETGAYEAVSHLIEDGHSRIGIITGLAQVSTTQERYLGYERALREHGLAVRSDWVKAGYSKREGGWRAAWDLLQLQDRPTAIFSTNNVMTLGALMALREMGLSCPHNVAVVGFDDHDWAPIFAPPLTVISQPTYEVGTTAAELLIQIMRGTQSASLCRVLPTELIIRASCADHGRELLGQIDVRAQNEATAAPPRR